MTRRWSAEVRAKMSASAKEHIRTCTGPCGRYGCTPKGLVIPSRQTLILDARRRPCADCGIAFPPEVMDFDHVPGRGEKLFGLGGAKARGRTLTEVAAEIRKCDVVCATCHRLRTYYRQRGAA